MKKQHVQLSEADRAYLEALISKGKLSGKLYRRALCINKLVGITAEERMTTFKHDGLEKCWCITK